MVKPRVHSQPSPTAPVWLSHGKLGFLYSLLSLSYSPCITTTCVPLSCSLYISLCCYVSFSFLFYFCLSALVSLSLCLNFSFYSVSAFLLTNTHTHTTLSISLPVSLSQAADWFSRRGSTGLYKHMALNLPSCMCWNGISFLRCYTFYSMSF